MFNKLFLRFYGIVIFALFIAFAVFSNPGWVKYADSHYYLVLAREWSQANFVLDDGTGTFVRPLAYLVYGLGYKLGGFDGIHLLNTSIVFYCILLFARATGSVFTGLSLLVFVFSKPFVTYSNSILLQMLGLSVVLLALALSFKRFRPFNSRGLLLNLLLIAGVFVHGGIVFLWLSLLVTLVVQPYGIYQNNVWGQFRFRFLRAFGYFLMLILVLWVMEIFFQERVFKSFFGESSFRNNPNLYYFGKFYFVYISEVVSAFSFFGVILVFFWAASLCLGAYSVLRGGTVNFYSLWLFFYLLAFEFLTFLKLMKRDPTSSEYLRTYFMAYPLLFLSAYSGFSSLSGLVHRLGFPRRVFSGAVYLLALALVLPSFNGLKNRLDKSPYFHSKEVLTNNAIIPRDAVVLLAPSNIYVHRRFFSDPDFMGARAKYFYDVCSGRDFAEALEEFSYVYIVKEKSIIDVRLDADLVRRGADCVSSVDYLRILSEKGYKVIYDDRFGSIHGVGVGH